MRLTIELVPSSSWNHNLRYVVRKEIWDRIRKECYGKANYKCEICDGVGESHPVEAHEEWEYNDETHIQKLVRIIALCPDCHKVKHIGLAGLNDGYDEAVKHFMKVNELSKAKAVKCVNEAFRVFDERSRYEWELDLSYLDRYRRKRGFFKRCI